MTGGEAMRRLYGLDHPTWTAPTNFVYTTATEAWEAIDRVYGADSQHVVVKLMRLMRPDPAPAPARPGVRPAGESDG